MPATRPSYTVVLTPFQLWLQTQCVKHAWSGSELAQRLGVAVTTAHGWWWGRMVPSPVYEERLATLTGVQLSVVRDLVWESRRLKAAQRATLKAAGLVSEGRRVGQRPRQVSASRRKRTTSALMYKPTPSPSSRAANLARAGLSQNAIDVKVDSFLLREKTNRFQLTETCSLGYEGNRQSQLVSLSRQDDRNDNCAAVGPEVCHAAA